MKKIFYLLSILLFFLSCSDDISYKEKITNYNNYYSEADSLYQISNYKDAISKLNKAVDITDTISKALLLRGECYQSKKQFDKADDDYSDVIDIEGKTSIAYKNRAINSLKQEDQGDFKDDIDNYILYHKKDTNALIMRANYYISDEDYENAISDYSTLIKLNANNANFYLERGNLYGILEEKSKSISDYEKYISISGDSDNSKIYYKKALLNFSLKKYSKAINDFNNIDTSFTKFDAVLAKRGEAYFLLQKYELSITDFSNFLKINPNNSNILEKRAEAFLITGNKTKSFRDFQKSSYLYWKNSSVFYKYTLIVLVVLLFVFLDFLISKFSRNINDNNTSKRIYLYFLFTGILGGHYLALKQKIRYYIYIVLVLVLLIYNNYEIISYYNNFDLFIFSLKITILNQILFFTIIGMLTIDLITIPFLVNYSNYKFQTTITPDKAIINGKGLEDIEKSLISCNSDFKNLKQRYTV